jgi:hypothetical protein
MDTLSKKFRDSYAKYKDTAHVWTFSMAIRNGDGVITSLVYKMETEDTAENEGHDEVAEFCDQIGPGFITITIDGRRIC